MIVMVLLNVKYNITTVNCKFIIILIAWYLFFLKAIRIIDDPDDLSLVYILIYYDLDIWSSTVVLYRKKLFFFGENTRGYIELQVDHT